MDEVSLFLRVTADESMKPASAKNKKRGPDRSEVRKAAEAAGLSRGQMYRCLAIASIPEEEFEELIESDDPPTKTALVAHAQNKEPPHSTTRRLSFCPHCGGDLQAGAAHKPS